MGNAEQASKAEKWSYIRHAENVRYAIIRWYFAVVGGVAAFGFSRIRENGAPETAVALSAFLAIFSLTILVFLLSHKKVYQSYVDKVLPSWQPGVDPFKWLFGGVVLVGATTVGALVYFIVRAWEVESGWGLRAGPSLIWPLVAWIFWREYQKRFGHLTKSHACETEEAPES